MKTSFFSRQNKNGVKKVQADIENWLLNLGALGHSEGSIHTGFGLVQRKQTTMDQAQIIWSPFGESWQMLKYSLSIVKHCLNTS